MFHEDLLTLSQAVRRIPGNPHISTVHRWRLNGIRGVRLETLKIGGRRFTSVQAIRRFVERSTELTDGGSQSGAPNPGRESRIVAAERELARAGI